jgi:preprotein translocase subunit SecG
MVQTLMIIQVVISVLLIITVLLQFGKGAEAGLMSGGGASDAVFSGAQKGNFLSKITTVLSVLFLAGSVNLARLQGNKTSSSLLDTEAPVALPLNDDTSKAAPAKTDAKAEAVSPVKSTKAKDKK